MTLQGDDPAEQGTCGWERPRPTGWALRQALDEDPPNPPKEMQLDSY